LCDQKNQKQWNVSWSGTPFHELRKLEWTQTPCQRPNKAGIPHLSPLLLASTIHAKIKIFLFLFLVTNLQKIQIEVHTELIDLYVPKYIMHRKQNNKHRKVCFTMYPTRLQ